MKPSLQREQRLYDALRHIARDFGTVSQIRRHAEKGYGLAPEEALEYAYENLQMIARNTIRGMKRPNAPKSSASPAATETPVTSASASK